MRLRLRRKETLSNKIICVRPEIHNIAQNLLKNRTIPCKNKYTHISTKEFQNIALSNSYTYVYTKQKENSFWQKRKVVYIPI